MSWLRLLLWYFVKEFLMFEFIVPTHSLLHSLLVVPCPPLTGALRFHCLHFFQPVRDSDWGSQTAGAVISVLGELLFASCSTILHPILLTSSP